MPRKPAAEANAPAATVHDLTLVRGQGGELHQVADRDTDVLTTAQGGARSQTTKIALRSAHVAPR
jgi:catalase